MAEKLKEYKAKRDFAKTLEPEGNIEKEEREVPQENFEEEGLRFVVQHHLARREHYDLRLEWDGVLLSWAVPKGPSYNTRDKRLAVQVEDHPLDYRNFEGTIPKGEYGGGVVMLWDEGFWEPYCDVDEGLREGMLKFTLKGKRLKGKWALVRMKRRPGEKQDNWLFLKEKDEYVQADTGTSQYTTSIRTGRTMEEINQGIGEKFTQNPFQSTGVQLAKLVNTIPQGNDWLYEMKYDGYRIVGYIEGNRARLITRNGYDFTERFRDVADSLVDWAKGRAMVLDGEMVVTDPTGKTDFQALQSYLKNPQGKNLTYIIFDLLALDGEDLREKPLIERKEILEDLMRDCPPNIYYSRHVIGKGKESFAVACEAGMEGIIGKKVNSLYRGTRNDDWIKLKCDKREEFVIGGYTLSDKRSSGVSSLLLGVYDGENLVYVGRAGTGFTEKVRQDLEEKFKRIKKMEPPFQSPPKARADEKITWLEPKYVAEIKYAEWTEEEQLRQASFKGLRVDKDPREVKREGLGQVIQERSRTMPGKSNQIIIEGIKISSPDKVIFEEPKVTKLDVIRYYERVAERMLPYVSQRILSIVRCPKGVEEACFYKKHPGPSSKEVVPIPITNSEGETEEYFYIENIKGLIAEAQMGTLEFHIWGSRVEDLEKPDLMVFDLDPDEGMELERVRQGVRDLKSILEELSLKSYLKTSGGKGYHVVVPLLPSVSWEVFNEFAKGVAQVMEQKWPDRYTSNVRKAKRANKIFIDWIRNGRGATSVAPYSLRARKGALVSMPITWDELNTVAPDGIDMAEAIRRVAGPDPWEDFFRSMQRLR